MARTVGKCPCAPQETAPRAGYEKREYTVQVVTPMFGGGVEPGKQDPVTLVRVPSIRGHLRFWWRATRGAACATVDELKRRETDIWGDTENPSPITVESAVLKHGGQKPCAHLPPGKNFPKFEDNHPGYALFPFQGNARENKPIGTGVYGLEFQLRCVYPKSLADDLNAALCAWFNFGGLGARTRRGCGALYCSDFAPPTGTLQDIEKWLKPRLAGQPTCGQQREWPTFAARLLIAQSGKDSLQCWDAVVTLLQRFRQGEEIGRNKGTEPYRPGRSRWPEPETIRKITERRLPRHGLVAGMPDGAFPRGEFGLPIVFHFKDGPSKSRQYSPSQLASLDPDQTELYPVVNGDEKTRMASPVIIKPLMINRDAAIPMILLLTAPVLNEVVLKKTADPAPRFRCRPDPRLASYPNSPMHNRSSRGNAIEAFLAFAQEKEQGFKEVAL